MLIPAGWLLNHLVRAIIIIVPLSMAIYYLFSASNQPNLAHPLDITPSTLFHGATSANVKKDVFVSQLVTKGLNPRFDGTALEELCASKEWNEGLIFKCDPAEGGIGNVRNIFLNCLRYAIEAGATSFILPTVVPLQKAAKSKAEPVSMAYFFEPNFFSHHLSRVCPQMTVLQDMNPLWDKPSTSPPITVLPESLDTLSPNQLHKLHQTAILENPKDWAGSFHAHMFNLRPGGYTKETPVLVNLKQPLLLQWPLANDTPELVSNLGLLLKFKREIREMAANILYAVDQNHRLRMDPLTDPHKIQPNLFYGAHLRTAHDAVAAGWTPYATQSQNYLAAAAKAELSVIYVSSDNKEDTKFFAHQARDKGIEATNALQALSAPRLGGEMDKEKKKLMKMERSIRHCVDWLVLSRASVVGGTWESSFSWGVAMARHRSVNGARWGVRQEAEVVQQENGGKDKPEEAPQENEGSSGDEKSPEAAPKEDEGAAGGDNPDNVQEEQKDTTSEESTDKNDENENSENPNAESTDKDGQSTEEEKPDQDENSEAPGEDNVENPQDGSEEGSEDGTQEGSKDEDGGEEAPSDSNKSPDDGAKLRRRLVKEAPSQADAATKQPPSRPARPAGVKVLEAEELPGRKHKDTSTQSSKDVDEAPPRGRIQTKPVESSTEKDVESPKQPSRQPGKVNQHDESDASSGKAAPVTPKPGHDQDEAPIKKPAHGEDETSPKKAASKPAHEQSAAEADDEDAEPELDYHQLADAEEEEAPDVKAPQKKPVQPASQIVPLKPSRPDQVINHGKGAQGKEATPASSQYPHPPPDFGGPGASDQYQKDAAAAVASNSKTSPLKSSPEDDEQEEAEEDPPKPSKTKDAGKKDKATDKEKETEKEKQKEKEKYPEPKPKPNPVLPKEGEPRVPVGKPNPPKEEGDGSNANGEGGKQAWDDGYTVIFGPEKIGEMFWGAMWP